MNTAINNLRVNVQEWSSRIVKSNSDQFGHKFKFFFEKINNNQITSALLDEAKLSYPIEDNLLLALFNETPYWHEKINILNESHHATIAHQIISLLINKNDGNYQNLIYYNFGGDNHNRVAKFVEIFINPIVTYLNDKLDESNSSLYLLSRYKKRVEWFTRKELLGKYNAATKNYEQLLDDDLRLFLFDQGIEYPFSTPNSPNGRADIVGNLETNDPLVLEVKVIDKEKGYGLNRLQDGITQILKYTHDYHKPFGFLVVFNLDELDIIYEGLDNSWNIPKIQIGEKTIFILTINLQSLVSASKLGKLKTINVNREDLITESSYTNLN